MRYQAKRTGRLITIDGGEAAVSLSVADFLFTSIKAMSVLLIDYESVWLIHLNALRK